MRHKLVSSSAGRFFRNARAYFGNAIWKVNGRAESGASADLITLVTFWIMNGLGASSWTI